MTKIGYLPLYVEMYDKNSPSIRPRINAFCAEIGELLKAQNLEVISADVCRLKDEFEGAIALFEKEKVDCIVTLHLAYSPSLESCYALAKTKLPILVLDTTPTFCFDYRTAKSEVMYNHGVHGVQDMCCMLRRLKKEYSVFAGHYLQSNVIEEVANAAKAIASANKLKNGIKVGMIGKPFAGMGDFVVEESVLKRLGITKILCDENDLKNIVENIDENDVAVEFENDKKICDVGDIDFTYYKGAGKVALGVRQWINDNNVDAFSINFQSVGELKGLTKMPFLEASKAMANGIGYAGEGDVLTAGVCGAFLSNFTETSFVEMFCPDWKNGSIFMSHMGEFNLDLMEGKKMIKNAFKAVKNAETVVIAGHAKGGKCCLVNVAPNAEDSFDVILVDGEMLEIPDEVDSLSNSISGWFKPQTDLREMLSKYSNCGGTHHSIIVYGANANSLKEFAKQLKLNYKVI